MTSTSVHPTSRNSAGQIVVVASVMVLCSGYCKVVMKMAARKELVWCFVFVFLFVVWPFAVWSVGILSWSVS